MKPIKMFLAAALLALPLAVRAGTPAGQVSSFSVNQALILELYNTAQQTQGEVTSWPPNMNAAVIQATVKNTSAVDQKLCFQVVVQEPGSACAGNNLVWSPIISSKDEIKAGETRVLTAADFEISSIGTGGGNFCTQFEEQIQKDFENVDIGNLQKAVDMFLKRRFQVCLVPVDCSYNASSPATPQSGNCTTLTLMQPNPGAQAQVGVLIYPHNNGVPDCNINFLWTPALYPGLGANDISYTLEVREGLEGEPLARVDIPAGQTYYQWSGRDRALEPGKKYHWRIVSRIAKSGKPFGGPDGRGWNIQKWFTCGDAQAAAKCRYTLADLDRYVQQNATPDVRAALKDFLIKGIASGQLDDPAVCALLSGKATLDSISVVKK
jgi:hypothetical protein